jgi:hypothetical protein
MQPAHLRKAPLAKAHLPRAHLHTARDPSRRSPGEHARAAVQRLRLRTLVGRFLISEIALLVSMFVVSRYVLPLLERRDRGASAEEHVGGLLEQLSGRDWRVLHDASLGHGNIDHILIGPGGVFTVETKSHPGPVRVGRLHGATLRQAQAERKAIESITGVGVEPLLVFSRAWVDRPLARRKGVRVVPARMLLAHLIKQPEALSREEIQQAHRRVVAALREHEMHTREIDLRSHLIR